MVESFKNPYFDEYVENLPTQQAAPTEGPGPGTPLSTEEVKGLYEAYSNSPNQLEYQRPFTPEIGTPSKLESVWAGGKQWAASQVRLLDFMADTAANAMGDPNKKQGVLDNLAAYMDPSDWQLSDNSFWGKGARIIGQAIPDLVTLTQVWMRGGQGLKLAGAAAARKAAEKAAAKGVAKEAGEKAAKEMAERYARVGAEEAVGLAEGVKAGETAAAKAVREAGEAAYKRVARPAWEGIPVFGVKGGLEAGAGAHAAGLSGTDLLKEMGKGAAIGGATGAAFLPLHGAGVAARVPAMAGIGAAGAAIGGAEDIEDYALEALTMAGFGLMGGRGIRGRAKKLGWTDAQLDKLPKARMWDVVDKGIRAPKDSVISERLQKELGWPEQLANSVTKEQGEIMLAGGPVTAGKPLRYNPKDFLDPTNLGVDWINAPGDDVYIRVQASNEKGEPVDKLVSMKLGREVVAGEVEKIAQVKPATDIVPDDAIYRAQLLGVELQPGVTWSEYAKALKDFRLDMKRKAMSSAMTDQERAKYMIPAMDANALANDIARILEADPKAYSSVKYLARESIKNYKDRAKVEARAGKKAKTAEEKDLEQLKTKQLRQIFKNARETFKTQQKPAKKAGAQPAAQPVSQPATSDTPVGIPLESVVGGKPAKVAKVPKAAAAKPAKAAPSLKSKVQAIALKLKMPKQNYEELLRLVSGLKGKGATREEADRVIRDYVAQYMRTEGGSKLPTEEAQRVAQSMIEARGMELHKEEPFPTGEGEVSEGKKLPRTSQKKGEEEVTPLEDVYDVEVPTGQELDKAAIKKLGELKENLKAAKANMKTGKVSGSKSVKTKATKQLESAQKALEDFQEKHPKAKGKGKLPSAIVTEEGVKLPPDVEKVGKKGEEKPRESIFKAREKLIADSKKLVDQLAGELAQAQSDYSSQPKGTDKQKSKSAMDKIKSKLQTAQEKVTRLLKRQATLQKKMTIKGEVEDIKGPRPWFSEWLENEKGMSLEEFFTEIEDIRHTNGDDLAAKRQLAYAQEYGARFPRTWDKGKIPKVDWRREAARKVPIRSYEELYGLKGSDGTNLIGTPLTEGAGKGVPEKLYSAMESVNPFFANEWAKNWKAEFGTGLTEGGKRITWGKLYDFVDRMNLAKKNFLAEAASGELPLYRTWIAEFAKMPWTNEQPFKPGLRLTPQQGKELKKFLEQTMVMPDAMPYVVTPEDQMNLYRKFVRENRSILTAVQQAASRTRHTDLDRFMGDLGWKKNQVSQFVGNVQDLVKFASEKRFLEAWKKLKVSITTGADGEPRRTPVSEMGTRELTELKNTIRKQMKLQKGTPEYDMLQEQQERRVKNFKMSVLEQGIMFDRDLWRYGFYSVGADGRVRINDSVLPTDRILLTSPFTGETIPLDVAIKMSAISRVTPKDMRRNNILGEIAKIENRIWEMDNTLDRVTRYSDVTQQLRSQLAAKLDQLYIDKAKAQATIDASQKALAATSSELPKSEQEIDKVPGDISTQGVEGTGPIDDPFSNVKAVFLTPEEYENQLNTAVRKGMASRKSQAVQAASLNKLVKEDLARQNKLVIERKAAERTMETLTGEAKAANAEREQWLGEFITNESKKAFKEHMVLWDAIRETMKGTAPETKKEKKYLLKVISEEARKLGVGLDSKYEAHLRQYSTELDRLDKKILDIEHQKDKLVTNIFEYDRAIERSAKHIEDRMGKYENVDVVEIPITTYQKAQKPLKEAAFGKVVVMPTTGFRSARSYIIGTKDPNVLESRLVRDVNTKVKYYINQAYEAILKEYSQAVSQGMRGGIRKVEKLGKSRNFKEIESILEDERLLTLQGKRASRMAQRADLLKALDRLIEMNRVRASMYDVHVVGNAEMTIVDKANRIVEMNDTDPALTIERGYPEESFKRNWLLVNGWHLLNKGWVMQGRGAAWEDLYLSGRANKILDPNAPAGSESLYRFLGEADFNRGRFEPVAYRPYEEGVTGPLRTAGQPAEQMSLADINWEGAGRKSVMGGTPRGVQSFRNAEIETTFIDKDGSRKVISAKALRDAEVAGFTGERKFIEELEHDANHIVFGSQPWDASAGKPKWMIQKDWDKVVLDKAQKKVDLKNVKYFEDWDDAVDYLANIARIQHPSLTKGQAKNISIIALKNTTEGMAKLQKRAKSVGSLEKMLREEYEITKLLKQGRMDPETGKFIGRLSEESREAYTIKLNAISEALKSLGVPSLEERTKLGMKPNMTTKLTDAMAGRIAEEKMQAGRLVAPEYNKMRYLDGILRELSVVKEKGQQKIIEDMIKSYAETIGDYIPEGMKPSEWAQEHVGEWYNVNRKNVYDNAVSEFSDKFPVVNQFIELNPAEKAAALSTIKNAKEIEFWKTMGQAALRNLYEEGSMLREIPKGELPKFLDEMKQLGFISEVDAFLLKKKGVTGGLDWDQANKAAQEAIGRKKEDLSMQKFNWAGNTEGATDAIAEMIKIHYNQGRKPGDLIGDARAKDLARRYVKFIQDPKNADLGYRDPTEGTFLIDDTVAVEVDFAQNLDLLSKAALEQRGLANWPLAPTAYGQKAAGKAYKGGVTLGFMGGDVWGNVLGIGKNIKAAVNWSVNKAKEMNENYKKLHPDMPAEAREELVKGLTREHSALRMDLVREQQRIFQDKVMPGTETRYAKWYEYLFDWFQDPTQSSNEYMRAVADQGSKYELSVGNARRASTDYFDKHFAFLRNNPEKDLEMNNHLKKIKESSDPQIVQAAKDWRAFSEKLSKMGQLEELGLYIKDYATFAIDYRKFYNKNRDAFMKANRYEDLDSYWQAHTTKDKFLELKDTLANNKKWDDLSGLEKELVTQHLFSWQQVAPEWDYLPYEIKMRLPKKLWNKYHQHRTLNAPELTINSFVDTWDMYVPSMINKIYGDQLLSKVRPLINSLPSGTGTIRNYLDKYVNRVMGRRGTDLDALSKRLTKVVGDVFGMDLAARYPVERIARAIIRQTYGATLGVSTAIRNTLQTMHTLVEAGPSATLRALKRMVTDRSSPDYKFFQEMNHDIMKEFGHDIMGKPEFVHDAKGWWKWIGREWKESGELGAGYELTPEGKPYKEKAGGFDKWMRRIEIAHEGITELVLSPMQFVENVNRGIAFFAGIEKAARMGKHYAEAVPMGFREVVDGLPGLHITPEQWAGLQTMWKTQYQYSAAHTSPYFSSPFIKMMTMFWSYPLKTGQMIKNGFVENLPAMKAKLKGMPMDNESPHPSNMPLLGEDAKFIRYLALLGFYVGGSAITGALGLDTYTLYSMRGLMPTQFTPTWAKLAAQAYKVAKQEYTGEYDEYVDAWEPFKDTLGTMTIPAYRTVKTGFPGLWGELNDNVQRGYRVLGAREIPLAETTWFDEFITFLGFPPSKFREARTDLYDLSTKSRSYTNRKGMLAGRGAKAYSEGDLGEVDQILKLARKEGIELGMKDIQKAVESKQRSAYDTKMQQAPKALRDELKAEYGDTPAMRGKVSGSRNMYSGPRQKVNMSEIIAMSVPREPALGAEEELGWSAMIGEEGEHE